MTHEPPQVDVQTGSESREYPSRLFFMDLLLKEVQKAGEAGKTLDEVLDQLRVIWTVRNREAVITQLVNHARRSNHYRFPEEMQGPVAEALSDLMRAAETLKPGERQKADFSISRIVKYLDPPHQIYVLAPWMESSRRFRENTVMRTLRAVEDLTPYADYVVRYFRKYETFETLRLISLHPSAAAQIEPQEVLQYFNDYLERFRSSRIYRDKEAKYQAMIAAKVLIIGDRSIPPHFLATIPEIFSWAIEHIGDPAYEPMLIWLIGEHPNNPEVLWSAVRTANRHFMSRALDKALDAARRLLFSEENVLVLPINSNDSNA